MAAKSVHHAGSPSDQERFFVILQDILTHNRSDFSFLEHYLAYINTPDNTTGETALTRAAVARHEGLVAWLIQRKATVASDSSDRNSLNAIFQRLYGEPQAEVKAETKIEPAGSRARVRRTKGSRPSRDAAVMVVHKNPSITLLQTLFQASTTHVLSVDTLFLIIKRKHVECTELLSANGVNLLGVKNRDGVTLLMCAAMYEDEKTAVHLLACSNLKRLIPGISVNYVRAMASSGRRALDFAIETGNPALMRLLCDNGACSSDDGCRKEIPPIEERIYQAAAQQDARVINNWVTFLEVLNSEFVNVVENIRSRAIAILLDSAASLNQVDHHQFYTCFKRLLIEKYVKGSMRRIDHVYQMMADLLPQVVQERFSGEVFFCVLEEFLSEKNRLLSSAFANYMRKRIVDERTEFQCAPHVFSNKRINAVYYAVLIRDQAILTDAIKQAPKSVNAIGHRGLFPVHKAAESADMVLIDMLVKAGAVFNMVGVLDGNTPLHQMLEYPKRIVGQEEALVRVLVDEQKVLVNPRNLRGETALLLAAKKGCWNVMLSLLERQADVMLSDNTGKTVVEAFIENADNTYEDFEEKRDMSADHEFCTLWQKITMAPDYWPPEVSPVLIAAQSGKWRIVHYFLSLGMDANAKNKVGETLFHYLLRDEKHWPRAVVMAAQYANAKTLQRVIAKRPDCLNRSFADVYPIHKAAKQGRYDVMKVFAEAKADFTLKTVNAQNTVLHEACAKGEGSLIHFLVVELKQEVNARNQFQQTPLMLSAGALNIGAMCALLEQRADAKLEDKEGHTALHHLVKQLAQEDKPINRAKLAEGLQLFAQMEMDGNYATGPQALTPLMLVVQGKNNALVACMVEEKGMDVNRVDKAGNTVLHHAASNPDISMKPLLRPECNPRFDAKNEHGETLLISACKAANVIAVQDLLTIPEVLRTLHHTDRNGNTALHALCHCMAGGRASQELTFKNFAHVLTILTLLLQHGALVTLNAEGCTPQDILHQSYREVEMQLKKQQPQSEEFCRILRELNAHSVTQCHAKLTAQEQELATLRAKCHTLEVQVASAAGLASQRAHWMGSAAAAGAGATFE